MIHGGAILLYIIEVTIKRSGIPIMLAGILGAVLFASTVFAAYEFYIVKLTSKNPINWTLVAKAIGSVQGVERTQFP